MELAQGLCSTVDAGGGLGGALMACHHSPEGEETICMGYALSYDSNHTLRWRFWAMDNRQTMNELMGWSDRNPDVLHSKWSDALDALEHR